MSITFSGTTFRRLAATGVLSLGLIASPLAIQPASAASATVAAASTSSSVAYQAAKKPDNGIRTTTVRIAGKKYTVTVDYDKLIGNTGVPKKVSVVTPRGKKLSPRSSYTLYRGASKVRSQSNLKRVSDGTYVAKPAPLRITGVKVTVVADGGTVTTSMLRAARR